MDWKSKRREDKVMFFTLQASFVRKTIVQREILLEQMPHQNFIIFCDIAALMRILFLNDFTISLSENEKTPLDAIINLA